MSRMRRVLVASCRLLLALTFIFSGGVKLIDPVGMQYKMESYATAFGFPHVLPEIAFLCFALALAVTEFLLGINLLFGIRRRTTASFVLAFMLIVTPLTLYMAVRSTMVDCGCFGDAGVLTNWQTFGKNIVLLGAVLVVMANLRRLHRMITERNQWLISLYSIVFSVVFALHNLYYLPAIDFRPFSVGTDVLKGLHDEWEGKSQKNEYADFCIQLVDGGGEDVTEEWLEQPGYKFLLVAPFLEKADDSAADQLNEIFEYSQRMRYPFVCLTSSSQENIEQWQDYNGAEYPFAWTDGTLLKTMIRSNPGLILLKGSTIVAKWPNTDYPKVDEMSPEMEQIVGTDEGRHGGKLSGALRLILLFVVPMLLFLFIDGLWIGSKYYKRYKIRHTNLIKLKRSMRKKIVAGNWKMNLNLQEGVALANELKDALAAEKPNCDVIICTPFIHLATVAGITEGTVIGLGAENCADKEKGAYTGEVSAAQVKSTGAQYVILGHSERRAYYGETAEILKEKVNLALANGLKVIFCIGEVLEEREANKQNEVVGAQLADSLFDLTEEQLSNIILAYEPVWAIGTGKTATADQAQDMHAFIRGVIAGRFGEKAAEEISILYGGSCKPSNAKEIFSKPDVDGGLIGGAALKCADFKGIIDAWN